MSTREGRLKLLRQLVQYLRVVQQELEADKAGFTTLMYVRMSMKYASWALDHEEAAAADTP